MLFSVDLIEDNSMDDNDSGRGDDTTDENDEEFDIQIPLQHRVRSATL